MPASFVLTLVVLALGGVAAVCLARARRAPTGVLYALAFPGLAAFYAVVMGTPFRGLTAEALVCLVSAAALAAPGAIFVRQGWALEEEARAALKAGLPRPRPDPSRALPALFTGAGALLLVLTFLGSRTEYASGVRWECSGAVVEQARSGTHGLPLVRALCGASVESFELVDAAFWSAARPGVPLVKPAGSPWATLNGVRVRMVPLRTPWWNDPP